MTQAFEHTTTVTLPVAPARAFRALIEPGELQRWLAPHAEVEPAVGGAYRVWGSAVLGAPPEPDPLQTITAIEPGLRLAFRWPLHGVDTDVAIALAPGETPDETKLSLRHDIHGELPYQRPRHVIDDVWRMHLGNLADHLRGRPVTLPDLGSRSPEVRVSIEIAAPPAKVFRALTVPELMNRWLWTTLAKVDLAAGEYSYGWSYDIEGRTVSGGPTRILEVVENQRLVTDWPDWRLAPGKPSTTVTWILDPLDDGRRTRVTLIHAGFELPTDPSDYPQGWAGFLEGLAKVAAES